MEIKRIGNKEKLRNALIDLVDDFCAEMSEKKKYKLRAYLYFDDAQESTEDSIFEFYQNDFCFYDSNEKCIFDKEKFSELTKKHDYFKSLCIDDYYKSICDLGTFYGIPEAKMIKLVNQSGRFLERGNVDYFFDVLLEKVRTSEYRFDFIPSYYQSPYVFLTGKQYGKPVKGPDLKIIENLYFEYQFPVEIINLMIDYILQISTNRLHENFVKSVAGTWSRSHVCTIEEAIERIEEDDLITFLYRK